MYLYALTFDDDMGEYRKALRIVDDLLEYIKVSIVIFIN